jgi:ubiquinone/menaquinone biosynthesis C-methylase UbiE
MKRDDYVHGYDERENCRLLDQANTLDGLLHGDTVYPRGSTVLEAGCGVGAQTVLLAKNSPGAGINSVDASETSVRAARKLVRTFGITNVSFQVADITNLPFQEESFDHVFVCFVLEHIRDPLEALIRLKSVLKTGGSITVIEGDHGSAYFYPESEEATRAIQCLVDIQSDLGGNALIGRQLFPLLKKAGFKRPSVSPRIVYADSSRPEWVEGFTRNTFNAMVEGVREQAIRKKLVDSDQWERGIADLRATTGDDGVFCYTFFKGKAEK